MSAEVQKPTDIDIFLFDLRGYLLLKNALSVEEVAACNAEINAVMPLKVEQWAGYIHGPSVRDRRRPQLAADL